MAGRVYGQRSDTFQEEIEKGARRGDETIKDVEKVQDLSVVGDADPIGLLPRYWGCSRRESRLRGKVLYY